MRPLLRAASAIAVVGALTSGCAGAGRSVRTAAAPSAATDSGEGGSASDSGSVPPVSPSPTPSSTADTTLPNLGPKTLAEVPADSGQVLEVVGAGLDSSNATVVLYQWSGAGWQAGPSWPAHNALRGWTADKQQGDLRSPIGVFGLTDAGGLDPDPGTKLPYYRSSEFVAAGRGFEGEPLAGSFDYVIAINYNRKAGVSPLDTTYPLGWEKGTGVWIHVDHGGPTHACVSIPRQDIVTLLGELDPSLHPVIVMGDAADLAR